MVQLLIDFVNKYNIIREMNKKDGHGIYPLLCAITKNYIETVQLLISYANKNIIILEKKENIYENYLLYLGILKNNNKKIKLRFNLILNTVIVKVQHNIWTFLH